jgi:hypothetical protein
MLIRPVPAVILCFLAIPALPQHVASIDLTAPIPPPSSTENSHLPSGCSNLELGVIADGFAKTEDGKPIDIQIKILSVSEEEPVEDSDIQLEVELLNESTHSIRIPWNTDPEIIYLDQSPTYYQWETGNFTVYVGHPGKGATPLKNRSRSLFGTQGHGETMLTVNPNESVSAKIKVKVKSAYRFAKDSLTGDSELFAKWHQTRRANSISDCKVTTTSTHYIQYYRQETPTIPITIVEKPNGKEQPDSENVSDEEN